MHQILINEMTIQVMVVICENLITLQIIVYYHYSITIINN